MNVPTVTSQDSVEQIRLEEEYLLNGDLHLNSLDAFEMFNQADTRQITTRKIEGKKNKSGGIYALLLQGCDEYENPREVAVPSTNTIPKRKNDRPTKSKSKSKSAALQPIEYDPKNHSIEPAEPEPTGPQKWYSLINFV